MDPELENGINPELEDDTNDVDVYGVEDDEQSSVDSFDLDGNGDEEDFDNLDDLDISDDPDAVDGKTVDAEPSAEDLAADLDDVVAQIKGLLGVEDDLGDLEGEGELELGGEGDDLEMDGDPTPEDELPGDEEEEMFGESAEFNTSTTPPKMKSDGTVDQKVVSGGNESATIKSNASKAKALPGGKKPSGDEAKVDPKEVTDTNFKAGKGTSKTNLPAAQNVLAVAKAMLQGNNAIINDLYSGKGIVKESFDGMKYKVDSNTIESIKSLDENVSEDLLIGLIPIFEKVVNTKVVEIFTESVSPVYQLHVTEAVNNIEEDIVSQIDSYMTNIITEYVEDNKKALEEAATSDIAKSFLGGLRSLYEDHSVDVPAGKETIVEKLEADNRALKARTIKLQEDYKKSKSVAVKARKALILKEASQDLTELQTEKLNEMASKQTGIKTLREFKEVVTTLKESAFNTQKQNKTQPQTFEHLVETVSPKNNRNSEMDRYTRALSGTRAT